MGGRNRTFSGWDKKTERVMEPMALIKCPECGRENVSDSAKSCPGCGYEIYKNAYGNGNNISDGNNLSSETTIKIDNGEKKQSNKSGKVILFIIAAIAVVVIFWIWYSSTRCVYPGCNEHKASSGNYCAYHKALLSSYQNYSSSSYSYDSRSKYDLKISDVRVHSNSVSSYCTGTITNNGDEAFKFVKVKGSFKDRNGNTIEIGDTYAVGGEGLEPGESTSFTIYCDKNSGINSCSVTVYDFD